MTKPYTPEIPDSSFPAQPYNPTDRLDYAPDHDPVTETFVVPQPDSEGRCRLVLNHVPRSTPVPVIEAGNILTPTPYGPAPAVSEVGLALTGIPIIEFHPNLAGIDGQITYTPLATPRTAIWENGIERELAAIEDYVLDLDGGGGGAVTSVNEQTGAVLLSASDVGAASAGDLYEATQTWQENLDMGLGILQGNIQDELDDKVNLSSPSSGYIILNSGGFIQAPEYQIYDASTTATAMIAHTSGAVVLSDDLTNTIGLSVPGTVTAGAFAGDGSALTNLPITTGPQGVNGLTGPQGAQGNTGSTGSAGSNGVQGAQGVQGNQGITGAQGNTGNTGSAGSNGVQGAQGRQGVNGLTGPQGLTGSNGTNGSTGVQGAQGTQGNQGNQGLTGSGVQGPAGSNGSAGDRGYQGYTGYQGPAGSGGGGGGDYTSSTTSPTAIAGLPVTCLGSGSSISFGIGLGAAVSVGGYGVVGLGYNAANGAGTDVIGIGPNAAKGASMTRIGIGYNAAESSGSSTIGVGYSAGRAAGSNVIAIGRSALSDSSSGCGTYCMAVGNYAGTAPNLISGNRSVLTDTHQTLVGHLTGKGSSATATYITCVGHSATAIGTGSVAVGADSAAGHADAVAIGYQTTTNRTNSVCIGSRDLEVEDATKGIILKAPDGTLYRLTVANGGTLTVTAV